MMEARPAIAEESRLLSAESTVFAVLVAVSFCHLLNDMMQSLLPAIYPMLKASFRLDFAEVGLIQLVFQVTASILQPLVGRYTDRRPQPYSLALGMGSTLCGLLLLSAAPNFALLLLAAALVGLGSSVFHPESSRVAQMASGGRHGLAQSLFQLGGNVGTSIGPLLAAFIVLPGGQHSIAWFSLAALLAMIVLWLLGGWYRRHGLLRAARAKRRQAWAPAMNLGPGQVRASLAVLFALMFSKFIYMASMSSYYTFYLIQKFHVSVRDAQFHLFVFLFAVAAGTVIGGPVGDRIGRRYVIWFSILGILPFTLILPYANLFWTSVLSVPIGMVLASAFPAIVVYGTELVPGKVGMISGLFFGLAFGISGLGAAALGLLADATSIRFVYEVCAFLPLIGFAAAFLPKFEAKAR